MARQSVGGALTDPGARDVHRAAAELASRIPGPLACFTELAYNYRWSWWPGGDEVFRTIDPRRWELCDENPVRLLQEVSGAALRRAAADLDLVSRAEELLAEMRRGLARPGEGGPPVVFICAEFGVHRSLPVYSGGLGVLAGDLLKEASDRGVPMVGVGLMYRKGYFQQRVGSDGRQIEYWIETDPERLPAARVTDADGKWLTVDVGVRGRTVQVQAWRVNVGRVPLYLLDADLPGNPLVDRWITARLYESDRTLRLAQYALLGIGGVRMLRAMGVDPAVVHLNEGHAALAAGELQGVRTVFTTHSTPAHRNTFTAQEALAVLGTSEPVDLTELGLRSATVRNAVSRRHGEVSREMWDDPGIGHVTNGVHLPTWMSPPMRQLLSGYLGEGFESRAADAAVWDAVEEIPDDELWAVRSRLRSSLVDFVRERVAADRLQRGESARAEAAAQGFRPDLLTIGFGRRLVGYKRAHVIADPRLLPLIDSPLQVVIAGKAHPDDDEAKEILRTMFGLRTIPGVSERVAYLENYEMGMARRLVAGCDVWINLSRPPLEASGTSGMKAALNGGLNLGVLDGWLAEAWDGVNGWGIVSEPSEDLGEQDARDAARLAEVIEHEVLPLFYDRDEAGVAHGWARRMKASLRTIGPRFSTSRVLAEYARIYDG